MERNSNSESGLAKPIRMENEISGRTARSALTDEDQNPNGSAGSPPVVRPSGTAMGHLAPRSLMKVQTRSSSSAFDIFPFV